MLLWFYEKLFRLSVISFFVCASTPEVSGQHDKQKKDATSIRARLLHILEVSVEADFLIFSIFRHYAGFLVFGHAFFEEIGFSL
jgi:hypothetical protein